MWKACQQSVRPTEDGRQGDTRGLRFSLASCCCHHARTAGTPTGSGSGSEKVGLGSSGPDLNAGLPISWGVPNPKPLPACGASLHAHYPCGQEEMKCPSAHSASWSRSGMRQDGLECIKMPGPDLGTSLLRLDECKQILRAESAAVLDGGKGLSGS